MYSGSSIKSYTMYSGSSFECSKMYCNFSIESSMTYSGSSFKSSKMYSGSSLECSKIFDSTKSSFREDTLPSDDQSHPDDWIHAAVTQLISLTNKCRSPGATAPFTLYLATHSRSH